MKEVLNMKTTVFYDGERGTARLEMVKEVRHDIDIHELTSHLVSYDILSDAVLYALDIESCEEADELLENDDIRQGLLLMVAHEIINHPTRY
jgi:hypothetical protein